MRRARQQEIAKPVKTLREACIERGVNPDGIKVPTTRQVFNWVDRIIPGKPDPESPSVWASRFNKTARIKRNNVRKMYPRTSAASDAALIAQGGIEAYVARFNQLNNLKEIS